MPTITVRDGTPRVLGVDLVHWFDGSDTAHQTLAAGKLSAWTDKLDATIVASQPTDALRPAAPTLDGEVRFTGTNINLPLPLMPRSNIEHTWFLMLARFKWSVFGPNSGSLFAVNGVSGTLGMKQPYCGYTKAGALVFSQWRNGGGNNEIDIAAPGDDVWHSIVGRRVDGACYLSIDGGAEAQLAGTLALPYPLSGQAGLIGDYIATGSIDWGLKHLIFGQGDRTPDDVKHLHQWARSVA